MRLGKRSLAGALGALALTVASVGYVRHRARAAARHFVPPELVDPPAGPRAPSAELLGVRVGASHVTDVQAAVASWGVACADRSVRVLMGEMRDQKRAEIAAAASRGTPDAVSGASILTHTTARDENPQVRLSCEGVVSSKLPDRRRAEATGRLLYVFDDAAAPLRHASYRRNHPGWDEALADFTATRAALSARLGSPNEVASQGVGGGPPSAPLPKYARREATFRFADLVASVSVENLGGHGFSVSETMEVPLPLRADAPAR